MITATSASTKPPFTRRSANIRRQRSRAMHNTVALPHDCLAPHSPIPRSPIPRRRPSRRRTHEHTHGPQLGIKRIRRPLTLRRTMTGILPDPTGHRLARGRRVTQLVPNEPHDTGTRHPVLVIRINRHTSHPTGYTRTPIRTPKRPTFRPHPPCRPQIHPVMPRMPRSGMNEPTTAKSGYSVNHAPRHPSTIRSN